MTDQQPAPDQKPWTQISPEDFYAATDKDQNLVAFVDQLAGMHGVDHSTLLRRMFATLHGIHVSMPADPQGLDAVRGSAALKVTIPSWRDMIAHLLQLDPKPEEEPSDG